MLWGFGGFSEVPHERIVKQILEIEMKIERLDTFKRVEKTLKHCYEKHVLWDDSIGWDELGDEIHSALCELIGDDNFVNWRESKNV